MPVKKDFLSVRNETGEKEHRQKRLVLCNLTEAYRQFKTLHPDIKVGFSKFAELQPKECVLAGATGTHSVCVCTIHQNLKLMMAGGQLEALIQKVGIYTIQIVWLPCNVIHQLTNVSLENANTAPE